MVDPSAQPITSLYAHVPFCARKCEYCAFFSEVGNAAVMDRYVTALVRELELVADDLRPQTIYVGGGTPSLLTPRHWEQIFRTMDRLHLLGAGEFTIECNPATVALDKARLWRDAGVNRVSMGVQSLNEDLLDRLGRIHSRSEAFKSFDLLRRAGFDNLNLDLMFAIPTQTMLAWQETLREAVAMGSEHLSSYEVIYEDDTPLFDQLHAGEFDLDEDLACDMYEELVRTAAARGYGQYEVANFARDTKRSIGVLEYRSDEEPRAPHSTPPLLHQSIPSFACQHNVNYWRGGSFYGLGPSATSYVRGVRTKNWSNTSLYCEQLEQNRCAIESREELSPLARAGETAAFGLRMTTGWPFADFQQVTGFDLREGWADEMKKLAGCGWARWETDRFHLTAEGLRFADAAAQEFLRT